MKRFISLRIWKVGTISTTTDWWKTRVTVPLCISPILKHVPSLLYDNTLVQSRLIGPETDTKLESRFYLYFATEEETPDMFQTTKTRVNH